MPSPTTTGLQDFYRGDLVEVSPEAWIFKNESKPRPRRAYIQFASAYGDRVTLWVNLFGGGWDTDASKVRLVRRGNWFRYRFGMPLEFSSIDEEATFWFEHERMHDLRNPADNLFYTWTSEQAIAALRNGSADAFFRTNVVGLSEPVFGGYTFDDPEVADRMRSYCLNHLTRS